MTTAMGMVAAGIKGGRAISVPIIHQHDRALTDAACDAVIALAAGFVAKPAGVQGASGYAPDTRVRDATTTYLDRTPVTAWLYARLDALFAEAASALALTVKPIVEPPQLVRYDVGGHFQVWHSDAGIDLADARRLSVSLELSAPDDHDGGVLEIAGHRIGVPRDAPRGAATFFPSSLMHRVTPVTRGTRFALVVWAGG